jgi:HAD superfamily hydrolase (TIGR01450 family)
VSSSPSNGRDLRRALAQALAGVRAFVLDADGVLIYRGEPIDGAPEALARLADRGIPYRVVTNYSSAHRSSLARVFGTGFGANLRADQIITAASAAAAYTATHHAGEDLLVLAAPDALREWDEQRVVDPEAADATEAQGRRVGAVVIGDAGDALSYRNLDIAYRQLRGGAAFVAMHRNPWWVTPRGPTLDAGAIVAGLEFAFGRRAIVCGKPSPVVFRQAVAELRLELRGAGTSSVGASRPAPASRLVAADVAMVGDDPRADVAAAQRTGLRGILVLSGKVAAPPSAGVGARPDGVAGSFADVVEAFLAG